MVTSAFRRTGGTSASSRGRHRTAVRSALGLLTLAAMAMAPVQAQAANTSGQVDLLRPESGSLIRSFGSAFDGVGDTVAMGDMTNDGAEEVVIANAGGSSENGRIDVLNAFGFPIRSFDSAYDAFGDSIAMGDITNDGADEVVVANAGGSSENGRIDVLNLDGFTISSFDSAYDASGDKLAVGDITGDGAEDIVVANNEGGGRMDVLDLFGHVIASFGNTGYDADDSVAVGDVTGDGRAEIVVVNTEGGSRVDVYGGTGGLLNRFASGVSSPKVMVHNVDGSSVEEIAIISTFLPGSQSTTATEKLQVFNRFGTKIRQVSTTFTAAHNGSPADGIALGNLNAGPLAEIVVANS